MNISDCKQCTRLSSFLQSVKSKYPDYHALPVGAFGDTTAKLLIVGLAPGMHGANRTGRPFTGDYAGVLLYKTLHQYGFATCPESISVTDNLQLIGCRITNAVKCLPPDNKPIPEEIKRCNRYLATELDQFVHNGGTAVLALGTIAHQAVLMGVQLKAKDYPFSHGAVHQLNQNSQIGKGLRLYDSYHCSRYNTQTKRLTSEMFEQVFTRIVADL